MSGFQQRVYNLVRKIKPGQTMTYSQVAWAIGSPNAARAVGNALNKNINSEIPCHRVVKADGSIGGYNRGAKLKEKLLREEGAI